LNPSGRPKRYNLAARDELVGQLYLERILDFNLIYRVRHGDLTEVQQTRFLF
jgi:hypothetical protein